MSYWASRYQLTPVSEPVTSKDIDFWGSREDLNSLARRLNRAPILPHPYELTVWVGAVTIELPAGTSLIEMLHTIPGLDSNDPEDTDVQVTIAGERLNVLSPVSLVLAKLHSLRHFQQSERNDLAHLILCLRASAHYIGELLSANARLAMDECERLLHSHSLKPFRRLQREQGFDLLDAIPLAEIRRMAAEAPDPDVQRKLSSFLEKRWPRVRGAEAL